MRTRAKRKGHRLHHRRVALNGLFKSARSKQSRAKASPFRGRTCVLDRIPVSLRPHFVRPVPPLLGSCPRPWCRSGDGIARAGGYQSGEIDYQGRISRRGDGRLRALLHEAAMRLRPRVRADSALCRWGLARIIQRGGVRSGDAAERDVVLRGVEDAGIGV